MTAAIATPAAGPKKVLYVATIANLGIAPSKFFAEVLLTAEIGFNAALDTEGIVEPINRPKRQAKNPISQ